MAGAGVTHIPDLRTSLGDPRFVVIVLGAIVLAVFPYFGHLWGQTYLVSLVAKMLIFAIAAVSLDLILGYGGMVSFGHAAYIGLGAYAVAVFSKYGIDNGYIQLAAAVLGSALVALFIGAISLRTSGVYFIMITLAFTQMLYYLGISLQPFGGDDGMNTRRSDFSILALGIDFTLNDNVFTCERRIDKACKVDDRDGAAIYYAAYIALIAAVWFTRRLVASRFGMVIRGSMSNAIRMQAIGYPIYRYRLTAFVIAGVICGIGGFLFANHQQFLSPVYMHWIRSGDFLIMVILGGMGTIYGAVMGAIGLLTFEEILEGVVGKDYWQMVLGLLLVALVLFAKKGLFGLTPHRWGSPRAVTAGTAFVALLAGIVWLVWRICSDLAMRDALGHLLAALAALVATIAVFAIQRRGRELVPRFALNASLAGLSIVTYILVLRAAPSFAALTQWMKSFSQLHLILASIAILLLLKLAKDALDARRPGGAAAPHG